MPSRTVRGIGKVTRTKAGKVTAFTISRRRWLRGKGHMVSSLFDGRTKEMCCLGFYLRECGYSIASIRGLMSPICVVDCQSDRHLIHERSAGWLVGGFDNSDACKALMDWNDRPMPDEDREVHIAELFKEQGITVTFVP